MPHWYGPILRIEGLGAREMVQQFRALSDSQHPLGHLTITYNSSSRYLTPLSGLYQTQVVCGL